VRPGRLFSFFWTSIDRGFRSWRKGRTIGVKFAVEASTKELATGVQFNRHA